MRFPRFFTLIVGLGSALASRAAHAEEPLPPNAAPPPPSADLPPPSARTTLIVAGAATTALSYGLALGASYLVTENDFRGSRDLRVPFAGPWLALSKTGCPASSPDCSTASLVIGAILSVLDGVAQAGGLGIVGEGLFLNTSSARSAPQKAEGPTVRALPFNFEKGGVGLGVVGTF